MDQLHLEATWTPHGFQVESMWSPDGVQVDLWSPCGVHMESVGGCKVQVNARVPHHYFCMLPSLMNKGLRLPLMTCPAGWAPHYCSCTLGQALTGHQLPSTSHILLHECCFAASTQLWHWGRRWQQHPPKGCTTKMLAWHIDGPSRHATLTMPSWMTDNNGATMMSHNNDKHHHHNCMTTSHTPH